MPPGQFKSLNNIGGLRPNSSKKKPMHLPRGATEKSVNSCDLRCHDVSVEKKTGGSVGIGAIGSHVGLLQALQHLWSGMMIDVSRSHRDYGEARAYSGKQHLGA